ncbi:MFS transporter [Salinimonas lutimaris]|uniref:MFS transporter n=1 Tax=Salinimonas lutimaris TaxID=914153 RepID=UPI0010C08E03|nr:MFS transporter [Salinimonas lutimaris]
MSLRSCLIALTLISAVCDTMLLPFYPQFFELEFTTSSPQHVGLYIAACCVTVMVCFPLWARLARRVGELHIWLVTQVISAGLGILCYYETSLSLFWLFSLAMLAFKASYLLIYPYVLRLESQHSHLGVVSLFFVLMHFGAIGGALIGGYLFTEMSPRFAFLVSAGGDALQVLLCLYLIRTLAIGWQQVSLPPVIRRTRIPGFIWLFGVLTLVVYFSSFLARPFFASHWLTISPGSNPLIAGVVYALPALMALMMLTFNHYRARIPFYQWQRQTTFLTCLGLASLALVLQSADNVWVVVTGRLLLGVAMFQVIVLLEVMMFANSEPALYATDFALINVFQNLGVIAASFGAGHLVSQYSTATPFFYASGALALTLALLLLVAAYKKRSAGQPINAFHAP